MKFFTVEDIVGVDVNINNFDKDEQQKKLEIIMMQRREKVEQWRLTQAKKPVVENEIKEVNNEVK